MLNDDRKHFVTASQASRVMAGFDAELSGRDIEKPNFDGIDIVSTWIYDSGTKPRVGDIKAAGSTVTGKDIEAAWKYIRSKEKPFTDGMFTVALEIAMADFIEQRDEGVKTLDMERGNIQEGEAISVLESITGVEFTNTVENQLFLSRGCLGVTPDGIEYNGFDINSCAEVKNPKDTTHMRYLVTINDQDDMLKYKPEYYWQAQAGLYVANAYAYHWMSYHNQFSDGLKSKYIRVTPVPEHIEILVDRAERVIEKAKQIAEFLNDNVESQATIAANEQS